MRTETTSQPADNDAGTALLSRRSIVSGSMALAVGLATSPAYSDGTVSTPTSIAISEGGFRYIPDTASPFSSGVAALQGNVLIRVRLRKPLPLEQGLEMVTKYLAGAGCHPSALAGLELRSPSVMSRAEFNTFNQRYLSALRIRGFVANETAPLTRTNVVPVYDPPKTEVVHAFTYAAPGDRRTASAGSTFLLSGHPEQAGKHVIAPGDVSPDGMRQKAGFVIAKLREVVTALGGSWTDLTGMQIYMTQPASLVADVVRGAGLSNLGPQFFVAAVPVAGFDGFRYEFEADIRSIELERVV